MYSVTRLVKREGKLLTIAGLWPNPAVDVLNIIISGKKLSKVEYSLVNTAGLIVGEKYGQPVANNQFSVNVSRLRPGLYLLVITDPATGEKMVSRFIMQ